MAATPRRVQGAELPKAPSDSDEIKLTKAELNALIANAVSAAVRATAENTPALQPTRSIDDRFSAPRTRLETDFNNRMSANNHLAKIIDNEATEWFAIPKIYEQYIGSVTASVNGQTIKIPADGVKRRVPVRYIPIIMAYVENVDKKVATMNATLADRYGGVAELKGGAF